MSHIAIGFAPKVLIGGHGESRSMRRPADFTREYLLYLRKRVGEAAEALVDFAEACERTDSSRYASPGIRRGEPP